MSERKISHALDFPEGRFIFIGQRFNGGNIPYFMRPGDNKAYLCYGDRKELLGKHAHTVKTTSNSTEKDYTLTYELEDDALIAARLITEDSRSTGNLTDSKIVADLNQKLEDGSFDLMGRPNKANIMRVLDIGNDQTIVVVENFHPEKRFTVFIGTPGNYQRLDVGGYVQGGNSFFIDDIGNGKNLELPWSVCGPNPREFPVYGGEPVKYLYPDTIHDMAYDFEKFGLKAPEVTHISPFTPTKKPPSAAAAKPFRR